MGISEEEDRGEIPKNGVARGNSGVRPIFAIRSAILPTDGIPADAALA